MSYSLVPAQPDSRLPGPRAQPRDSRTTHAPHTPTAEEEQQEECESEAAAHREERVISPQERQDSVAIQNSCGSKQKVKTQVPG